MNLLMGNKYENETVKPKQKIIIHRRHNATYSKL